MHTHCIYCGKAEVSDEDVFPEWLREGFKGAGEEEYQLAIDQEPRLRRRDSLKVCVRCACTECNNGWMSLLQEDSNPIILRLLHETTCELDVLSQRKLSLWAVMSAMSLEASNEPGTWRFTPLECTKLRWSGLTAPTKFDFRYDREYVHRELPKCTSVWIAKWANSPGPSYVGRVLGNQPPHQKLTGEESVSAAARASGLTVVSRYPSDRALVTTFGFGSLVFQVVKEVPADSTDNRTMWVRPGLPWEQILRQILPLESPTLFWPPPRVLVGEPGLEALELRFSRPDAEKSDRQPRPRKRATKRSK
jgi:hypothetical protein